MPYKPLHKHVELENYKVAPYYMKLLIRDLYKRCGFTGLKIAEMTGYPKSTVYTICKGITRSRSEASRINQPPPSMNVEASRYRARKAYMKYYNIKFLPRNMIVHHKDENPLNNDISNLELLTDKEHGALHNPKGIKSIKRGYKDSVRQAKLL